MKLTFYGAAREVTGSCALIETGKTRVLVDCGMFQGGGHGYQRNLEPFPFEPSSIDAVIMTHAHIDHIGRIPKLVKDGFNGRIFSTHPTRLFSKLMWQDASRVMKDEARKLGLPRIYKAEDVGRAYGLTHGVEYDTKMKVSGDVSINLRESGHIFGSSFIEIEADGVKLVMSGDLGNDYVPILRQTADIGQGDVIVMESTYGNRVHEEPKTRAARLQKAVVENIKRKGVLLIPAFSLERTQELLYELNDMVENHKIPNVPIYLDSPLAIKVIPIYHQFPKYYDTEAAALKKAGDDFLRFPGLHMTTNTADSLSIKDRPSPKIIIAGSGMMHGGRIMHHLVDYLADPKNSVLIVGYQSAGTLGRKVQEGVKIVHIDHQEIEVKASVEVIGAYSAHADQSKLLRWVSSGKSEPKKVILNHGELEAMEELAGKIRAEQGLDVVIPEPRETLEF